MDKISDLIIDEALSTLSNKTDNEFLLKLEKDSNAIAAKTQLHPSFYKATCFKYKAAILRQCQFYFPQAQVSETTITS